MKLTTCLIRETPACTISELHIDGVFECFILQDGKTGGGNDGKGRIPAGLYVIGVRTVGEKDTQYAKRYANKPVDAEGKPWHIGMLELLDVLNYVAILIHIGNVPQDTLGCLLTGTRYHPDPSRCFVSGSATAYERLYAKVRGALLNDEQVTIEVGY